MSSSSSSNDNDGSDDEAAVVAQAMEVEAVVDEEGDEDEGDKATAEEATLETAEVLPQDDDNDNEDDMEGVDETNHASSSNGIKDATATDAVEVDEHEHDAAAIDQDEDDGEEVLAAVVVDEDDDDNDDDIVDAEQAQTVQVAEVVAFAPEAAAAAAAPKKSPRKKIKKKVVKRKKKKRRSGIPNDIRDMYGAVPPERKEVATDARHMLQETVPTLPIPIAESQVRSFGRLYMEPNMDHSDFSSTIALYPIGFSCDRYEFSPVHGRILKLRCSILSGRAIKEQQTNGGFAVVNKELGDGPVFRVLWGQGVDEDVDDVEYPFDPFQHASPLRAVTTGGKAKKALAAAVPENGAPAVTKPGLGMRVKVRFDKNQYYTGTLVKVGETKKRRKQVEVTIRYDDGSYETTMYPDPDIALLMPGVENDIDAQGRVDVIEINGKPVTSVFGMSPLEAWGQVLSTLGLIDEIMYDSAIDAVKASRAEGLKEAKDKMEAKIRVKPRVDKPDGPQSQPDGPQSQPESQPDAGSPSQPDAPQPDAPQADAPQDIAPQPDGTASLIPSPVNDDDDDAEMEEKKDGEDAEVEAEVQEDADDREPPSEREKELRLRYQELLEDYEAAKEQDRSQSVALANARIRLLGHFLCNPFHDDDSPGKSQLSSWLATAVRKEKTRMGSTGNKKKVVTALDLLERNDTFYNTDIEALIEGLPGSEYCSSYVFQAFRAAGPSGLNRAWIHEAQLHREKEALQRQKRARESHAKEQVEQERVQKKRKREEDRDARKRQKTEEEDVKKKARTEERMSRLKIQVDDRLFKEATFQREKTISAMARSMTREFIRRRRAAELIAGQSITRVDPKPRRGDVDPNASPLPPLSKVYDEDAVRVWNFISTFGSFFLERGYVSEVPTLDSLQAAVNCLRGTGTSPGSRMAVGGAVSSLTELAVALCKPLAASLTRVLFASLIALNPVLQKDFGAAFFNEVNANATSKEPSKESSEDSSSRRDVLLPVTAMTWQEIARVAFLSDALGELGYSRHEAAHLLRGYRSAGHPNSKEARRLRRTEDFAIALMRQEVADGVVEPGSASKEHTRIEVPCTPSCNSSDFRFYLHNVNSLPDTAVAEIRHNLSKALELFDSPEVGDKAIAKSDLDNIRRLLDGVGSSEQLSKAEAKVVKNARLAFLKLFRIEAGAASDLLAEKAASGDNTEKWSWQVPERNTFIAGKNSAAKPRRQRMGLLNSLELTPAEYKKLSSQRELYMEEALRLKEEMERKSKADEEEDDEEEDDEEEGNGISQAVVVSNGDAPQDDSSKPAAAVAANSAETSEADDSKKASIVPENGVEIPIVVAPRKIGKETAYDDFCADIPDSPELVRRCMAVLRTLTGTGPAEPFQYPVDPQSNPGYYDTVLRPMCLREVGKQLMDAAAKFKEQGVAATEELDEVVAQFGRNVRLIAQNCLSYANAGPTVISAGSELLRIFERLFLDWVLAPAHLLPGLDDLDDDRCVEHHASDEESTVLFCDGCEGKYNIARLDPPLKDIPKGDWYCPRCVTGRSWAELDPRLGKNVSHCSDEKETAKHVVYAGRIEQCLFRYPEHKGAKPTLMYQVMFPDDRIETWSLEEVDKALLEANTPVPSIRCLEAVAESPGYGLGVDKGLRGDLIPVPMNPNISDSAAQVALSSSVFRDTITASGTLLVIDPQEMTASEWLRLLVLLVMKCSSSDVIQNIVGKMETEAAEKMVAPFERVGKISNIREVLPDIADDEGGESDSPVEESAVAIVEEPAVESVEPVVEPVVMPIVEPVTADAVMTEAVPTEAVPSSGDAAQDTESAPVLVEASAVEVVADEMDIDGVPVTAVVGDATLNGEDKPAKAVVIVKPVPFANALSQKAKRQKKAEDSIAGFCIKNQLRPVVASFEEDAVSQAVDSALSAKDPGLDFSRLRCRRMVCSFCSLTDVALGSPLVRVPSEEEWDEVIPHCARSRRTHLVADMADATGGKSGLVAVTIRVDGELVSVQETDFDGIEDGGMVEFAPRSEFGFQAELLFRYDTGLPFITGSLSAHECCAIARHNARKENTVQRYKERQAELVEKEAGMTCGRTLEIGRDRAQRSYWKFSTDPDALFVCSEAARDEEASDAPTWCRFPDAESIASVIVSLDKDGLVKDLQRAFPASHRMVKHRTWTSELLKRKYPRVAEMLEGKDLTEDAEPEKEIALVDGGFEPYEVGEEVLVESKPGQLMWDANVTGVSRRHQEDPNTGLLIDAYRVEYKGWSSRFIEWVEPNRVVEPNENNRLLQEEMLAEVAATHSGLPIPLTSLIAATFLHAKDRVRGSAPLPDFTAISSVRVSKSSSEWTFALMKAALLVIEAALPLGAVDHTESGVWRPEFAHNWRQMVQHARGPATLMRCVILLEDTVSEEWLKEDIGHLRSCLSGRWKALGEASPSGLAIRIILLDRAIMYGTIDRKRFGKKKSGGNNKSSK